jgi:uncharacterized membrane protein YccC
VGHLREGVRAVEEQQAAQLAQAQQRIAQLESQVQRIEAVEAQVQQLAETQRQRRPGPAPQGPQYCVRLSLRQPSTREGLRL